ncbi:MAG: hypothetical protein DRN12_00110 [Thermoplasmata archaeon]|nr:MAG: hypothetical protein DRN12_00110 [Thermoplasmata archaeon]HEC89849.1 DUF99 family protein [Thermoplasmatales archaeon]
MKVEIRLLGIDDAPFSFREDKTLVVGVIMRGGAYIEGVLRRDISIDGLDSTEACIDMVLTTRHRKQLRAMLLDGVSLGGFNIVDIEKVFNETEVPVITVTRDKPDFDKIKSALKKHFSDWEKRFDMISKGSLHVIKTSYNPIYVKCAGILISEAKEIIKISTIRGVIPEPIRVAHLIASGIKRGESYGKA